mgnify:CR=1 FL=1
MLSGKNISNIVGEALAVLFFSVFSLSLKAQDLMIEGMDSAEDSVAVREIRARMDSIRQHRPTVALVLSGGGAKGAAHVGVMEYLETIGMPIDLVVGTSVGGLIGGFYAVGYTAEEIREIVYGIDWEMALSDKVPREYISYAETKYKEKYMLSFPFYYSKDEYLYRKQIATRYDNPKHKYEDIHLGADEGKDATKSFIDNIVGSLPSGYAYGQNVNNIFSKLTVGYQDSTLFYRLPIPFVCVATEMVSSRAKIWYGGKLNRALRSTMSIPGVYAPVREGGMILVDGGMKNNYPTDIARNLGADFIIGVDLSSGYSSYSGINNILDIISQGVDMLGRESYEKNSMNTEVTVKPDLHEFDMLSFSDDNIHTIYERGLDAALEQADNIGVMKILVGDDTTRRDGRKAVDITKEPVMISEIRIEGVSDKESKYLMSKIDLDVFSKVNNEDIEDAVAKIYATKSFDYVTYELLGDEEPYRLVLNCARGPIHQLGVGARFDTEEIVSLLVNLGINVHSIRGSAFDLTGKIGTNPYVKTQYYYRGTNGQTFNVAMQYRYSDRNRFNVGDNRYKVVYHNYRTDIYLSNINWKKFDLGIGIRNDFYSITSLMGDNMIGEFNVSDLHNSYVSAFLKARMDTLDDGCFPTGGVSIGADYQWVMGALQQEIDPLHIAQFKIKGAITPWERFTFVPSLSGRFVMGGDTPLPYINLIGGSMEGRYFDQQIPFIGVNFAAAVGDILLTVGGEFRYRLMKNHYLSAIVNFGDYLQDFKQATSLDNHHFIGGAGLQYSFDTIVGPLSANVHWSDVTNSFGAYFSLGFDF